MEIVSAPRQQTIVATPNDPRCVAIAERYGSSSTFLANWSPAKSITISGAIGKSANVPTLVMFMKTYGNEVIETMLQNHVAYCIGLAGLGDKFSQDDYPIIAKLICDSERLRTLNLAFIVAFFAKFLQGEYKLYGYTPFVFMQAMHNYYNTAKPKQEQIEAIEQKRIKDIEWQKHKSEAISWKEYCEQTGTNPNHNPIDELLGNA